MTDQEIDLLEAARALQREMLAEGQSIGALIVAHLIARLEVAESRPARVRCGWKWMVRAKLADRACDLPVGHEGLHEDDGRIPEITRGRA